MFNRMLNSKIGETVTVTINSDVEDWNLITEAFAGVPPSLAKNVLIINNAVVTSSLATTPAMDLTGLPAGSLIKIINNGYIIGRDGGGR